MLMAADSIGVTDSNLAAFLAGTVTVTPVFFESNGAVQSQNWTEAEIDETLARITEGVNWWSRALDKLDTVHTLDFVIDDTFAREPVLTPLEPIDNSSNLYTEYVGAFMTGLGYGEEPSLERAVQKFNHEQRLSNDTDWAFTIFIADSSDDPDGLFESGGFGAAFALASGAYFVSPSTRPASTFAHEMGHIFWARDEYPGGGSYTDRRGYYNTQLLNAADNPDPNFVQENSIMRGGIPLNASYVAETSPESTLAFVGWRDSDGDGIFDFADVPLEFDFDGYFDEATSTYNLAGSVSAVPLRNLNSSGTQSDITLNMVDEIQYRLDSGAWQTASVVGQQQADVDLAVQIEGDFDVISWRAIDLDIGVTSEVVTASRNAPSQSSASIQGFGFLDGNANGTPQGDEDLLAASQVTVRNSDGSDLFQGHYTASDFAEGPIEVPTPGVEISADGALVQDQVGVFASDDVAGNQVFQYFRTNADRWEAGWDEHFVFVAEFSESVGNVQVSVNGFQNGGYARVEGLDATGTVVVRSTTDFLDPNQTDLVQISDDQARIASVRVFGHADTSVAILSLDFGNDGNTTTGDAGTWSVDNLPDGDYQVTIESDRLIHQYEQSEYLVTVSSGTSPLVAASAVRVVSARHNITLAEDVSGEGDVSARDALLVINDISKFGARLLTPAEAIGDDVDVNDDGFVTSIDALLVINALSSGPEAESEPINASIRTRSVDQAIAGWSSGPSWDEILVESDGRDAKNENSELTDALWPKEDLQVGPERGSGSEVFDFTLNYEVNENKKPQNGEGLDPLQVANLARFSRNLSE